MALKPRTEQPTDGKRLWFVNVTEESEVDCWVWAEDEDEAERIANSEVEMDNGYRHASAHAATLEEIEKYHDQGERPWGDCPDGMPVTSQRVGDTVADALRYLRRTHLRSAAYAEFKSAQATLFPGVDPVPVECSECGSRYPMEEHEPDCPKLGGEESA